MRAPTDVGALNNNKMLKFALIGAALVVITVIIHAVGTAAWLRVLGRRYTDSDGMIRKGKSVHVLVGTVLALLILHSVEIVVWAYAFLAMLPAGELASFEESVYFSFVTFTTLGYGDITLTENWRLLSGIEALNGLMQVGWTTAMLFAVVQRTWQTMGNKIRGEQEAPE